MSQAQGFTVENQGGIVDNQGRIVDNQGGTPASIVGPNLVHTTVNPTVTSKLFTMKGQYVLRGLPAGGSTEVDLFAIKIDAAGLLQITPVSAYYAASYYVVHILMN